MTIKPRNKVAISLFIFGVLEKVGVALESLGSGKDREIGSSPERTGEARTATSVLFLFDRLSEMHESPVGCGILGASTGVLLDG